MNYYYLRMKEGTNGNDDWDKVQRFLSEEQKIGIGGEARGRNTFQNITPEDIVIILAAGQPVCMAQVVDNLTEDNTSENRLLTSDIGSSFDWLVTLRKVKILSWYKEEDWSNIALNLRWPRQTCGSFNNNENSIKFAKLWYQKIMKNTHMKNICRLLEHAKNIVLTGSPGTGKTHLAREVAKELTGNKEECIGFCQFHPSFDYTDFVEGLRPVEKNGVLGFERKDGMFKEFCKKALKWTRKNSQDNFAESWNRLIDLLNENHYAEISLLSGKGTFKIELNTTGTGLVTRTYESEEFETRGEWKEGGSRFYNDSQLYNIYRGLPGVQGGGHDNYRRAIVEYMKQNQEIGLLEYKVGEIDELNAKQPFVFIIDEINRGDISRIFGELFFAIDPGYRGGKEGQKVQTQYTALIPEGDEFKEGFFVPDNVYIIGTMNDIDRSVESMDFAIRRRFVWQQVTPEDSIDMLDTLGEEQSRAKSVMRRLNEAISAPDCHLGKIYQLGGAYFLKLKNLQNDYEKLWFISIEPLLREYLRGNAENDINDTMVKLKKVYDDAVKAEDKD